MIDNVSDIAELWSHQSRTLQVPTATLAKLLGAEPRRWYLYFQLPAAIISNYTLFPLSGKGDGVFWSIGAANTPLKFSQKDDGPFASGEWYITNTGGASQIIVTEILWLG